MSAMDMGSLPRAGDPAREGSLPRSALARAADGLDAGLRIGSTALLTATTVLLFLSVGGEVIVRYVTRESLSWSSEVPSILFPWMTAAGILVAAQYGQHFAVEFTFRIVRRSVARIIFAASQIVSAAVFFYLAWTGVEVLEVVSGESMPVTGLSNWWAYLSIVVCFVGLGLTALTTLRLALARDEEPLVLRAAPRDLEAEGGI